MTLRALMVFTLLFFYSCSSSEMVPEETTLHSKTEPVKKKQKRFFYKDLAKEKKMMGHVFESNLSADQELIVSEIPGPVAMKIIESQGLENSFEPKLNEYIRRLLSHEEAIVWVYEFPPDPGLPVSNLYIPFPVKSPLGGWPEPGVIIATGMGPTQARPELANSTNVDLELLTLKSDTFLKLKKDGQKFVVFLHASGCGSSQLAASALSTLLHKGNEFVFLDPSGKVTGKEVSKIIGSVIYPTFIFFENGEAKDFYISVVNSPIRRSLKDFFVRNKIIEGSRDRVTPIREARVNNLTWKRRIGFLNHWPSSDFEHQDLSGLRLRKGSLSGSSMRSVNLENADFRQSILTKVDFTNSNLKGAQFDGAYFRDSTCPNGKSSNDYKNSCPKETWVKSPSKIK